MHVKTTIASLATAFALTAAPALADRPVHPGHAQATGKASAPGQLCRNESRKKTNHGRGKSPFAACVIGAARAQHDAATKPAGAAKTAPGVLCRDQSRKKAATDAKSPFAACVTGAAKAQKQQS
jgi:hypothetical protein